MTALKAQNISVTLKGRQVLSDVSLEVRPGECVGLIGPNGAGKTTLLRAMQGLVPFEGNSSLADLPVRSRAQTATFLPQAREIAWPMRVDRMIALGRLPHLAPNARIGEQDQNAIDDAIEAMDLVDLSHRPATELSGGEKARVLIARALAQQTPFLLADEPAAGLDPGHQIALMETLQGLSDKGRGLLVSLHDLGHALRYCTRLVLLSDGRVHADGEPQSVLNDENLAQVFGVRAFRGETENGPVFQSVGLSHSD